MKSNSLDIDFIHSEIHGRSCKNTDSYTIASRQHVSNRTSTILFSDILNVLRPPFLDGIIKLIFLYENYCI